MSPDSAESRRPVRRQTRFLPPIAGGDKKTGWEDLDKWVGSGGAAAAGDAPAASASGKTGWEDLDKWVGSSGAAAAGPTLPRQAPRARPAGKTSTSGSAPVEPPPGR